jgi:hypothetical protein
MTPVVRTGLGVAIVLTVPLVATLATESVDWTLGDFVVAAALLTLLGAGIELALRRAGSRLLAVGIALVGAASAVLGEVDDAPGLVLLGLLLVACACVVARRQARRRR